MAGIQKQEFRSNVQSCSISLWACCMSYMRCFTWHTDGRFGVYHYLSYELVPPILGKGADALPPERTNKTWATWCIACQEIWIRLAFCCVLILLGFTQILQDHFAPGNPCLNSSRLEQHCRHFANDIFKCTVIFRSKFHWSLFRRVQSTISQCRSR